MTSLTNIIHLFLSRMVSFCDSIFKVQKYIQQIILSLKTVESHMCQVSKIMVFLGVHRFLSKVLYRHSQLYRRQNSY
jgi:hypothetical protein